MEKKLTPCQEYLDHLFDEERDSVPIFLREEDLVLDKEYVPTSKTAKVLNYICTNKFEGLNETTDRKAKRSGNLIVEANKEDVFIELYNLYKRNKLAEFKRKVDDYFGKPITSREETSTLPPFRGPIIQRKFKQSPKTLTIKKEFAPLTAPGKSLIQKEGGDVLIFFNTGATFIASSSNEQLMKMLEKIKGKSTKSNYANDIYNFLNKEGFRASYQNSYEGMFKSIYILSIQESGK